jgi:hypothetical protein
MQSALVVSIVIMRTFGGPDVRSGEQNNRKESTGIQEIRIPGIETPDMENDCFIPFIPISCDSELVFRLQIFYPDYKYNKKRDP